VVADFYRATIIIRIFISINSEGQVTKKQDKFHEGIGYPNPDKPEIKKLQAPPALKTGYCSEIGYWDFRPIAVLVKCLNLPVLLPTLTVPWVIVSSGLLDGGSMIDITGKGREINWIFCHQ